MFSAIKLTPPVKPPLPPPEPMLDFPLQLTALQINNCCPVLPAHWGQSSVESEGDKSVPPVLPPGFVVSPP